MGFLDTVSSSLSSATSLAGSSLSSLSASAPSSQKAGDKPISFILDDQNSGAAPTIVTLSIRPEDLVRPSPSRLAVHQTFGGGWVDNWGPGVPTITLAGHTGWRGGADGDGMAIFQTLYTTVFEAWHLLRAEAVIQGKNPANVRLLFSDKLDDFLWEVAPQSFVLRRNKARPLLMQYNIQLPVISTSAEAPPPDDWAKLATPGGGVFDSLKNVLAKLKKAASSITKWINTNIVGPIKGFLTLANNVISTVTGIVKAALGIVTAVTAPLVSLAHAIAETGHNLFAMVSAVINLPSAIKGEIMGVASAFSNAACVFANAFRVKRAYPQYDGLYGASNCSSTTGGRALSPFQTSNTNPFAVVSPAPSNTVSVSPSAQQSMQALRRADPVLSPLSANQMAAHLSTINSGVVLA